jgi:hypothetical protein
MHLTTIQIGVLIVIVILVVIIVMRFKKLRAKRKGMP